MGYADQFSGLLRPSKAVFPVINYSAFCRSSLLYIVFSSSRHKLYRPRLTQNLMSQPTHDGGLRVPPNHPRSSNSVPSTPPPSQTHDSLPSHYWYFAAAQPSSATTSSTPDQGQGQSQAQSTSSGSGPRYFTLPLDPASESLVNISYAIYITTNDRLYYLDT